MNNRGFVAFIIPILIAIIGITGVIAFLVSPTMRYTIIGCGIIAAALFAVAPPMLSGEFTNKKLVFFFLIVAVGVLFIFIPKLSFLPQIALGTSYLSIDRIDYVGQGSMFHILASGGSAEQLKIDWDQAELNTELKGDGYMVDRGITADIVFDKWEHSFPITLTSQTVNLINKVDAYPIIGGENSCELSDCSRLPLPRPDATWVYIYTYGTDYVPPAWKCMCIYQYPNSKIGTFASGSANLDYNIKFNVEGEIGNMNNQNPVVSLKSGKFIAEYRGTLGTLFQLSAPQYQVLWTNDVYQWLVQSNAMSYNTRGPISNPSSYFTQCMGAITNEVKTNGDTCVSNFNADINTALARKNDEYKNKIGANAVNLIGDKLIVDEGIPSFTTLFTIKLDAAWVGLKELKGDPSITTCAQDLTFNGGTQTTTNLVVYNQGTEAGQFDYTVSCTSPQIQVGGVGGYVEKKTSSTIPLTFSGTNDNPNADLKGSCTHAITDRKSQKKVSCTSQVTIKYSITCTPNLFRCKPTDAKVLQQCNNEGIAWVDKQICPKTCGYDAKLKTIGCVEEECPTGQTRCVDGICREKCMDDDYCKTHPTDSQCDNTKYACEAKALSQSWLGWTWVEKESCGFWCSLGLSQPTITGYCSASFIIYYIIGGIVIVFGILIILLFAVPNISLKKIGKRK